MCRAKLSRLISAWQGPIRRLSGTSGINSNGTGLLNNNRIDSGLGKVDYHINDKHSLNAMYFISPGNGVE